MHYSTANLERRKSEKETEDIIPIKWSSPNESASAGNSSALRKPSLICPIEYDEKVAF